MKSKNQLKTSSTSTNEWKGIRETLHMKAFDWGFNVIDMSSVSAHFVCIKMLALNAMKPFFADRSWCSDMAGLRTKKKQHNNNNNNNSNNNSNEKSKKESNYTKCWDGKKKIERRTKARHENAFTKSPMRWSTWVLIKKENEMEAAACNRDNVQTKHFIESCVFHRSFYWWPRGFGESNKKKWAKEFIWKKK